MYTYGRTAGHDTLIGCKWSWCVGRSSPSHRCAQFTKWCNLWWSVCCSMFVLGTFALDLSVFFICQAGDPPPFHIYTGRSKWESFVFSFCFLFYLHYPSGGIRNEANRIVNPGSSALWIKDKVQESAWCSMIDKINGIIIFFIQELLAPEWGSFYVQKEY